MVDDVLLDRFIVRLKSKTVLRQDLAKMIGVGQTTMYRWKERLVTPKGAARAALVKVLDKLDKRLPLEGERKDDDGNGKDQPQPKQQPSPISEW